MRLQLQLFDKIICIIKSLQLRLNFIFNNSRLRFFVFLDKLDIIISYKSFYLFRKCNFSDV